MIRSLLVLRLKLRSYLFADEPNTIPCIRLSGDLYLHLGGDEVQFACWNQSDSIHEYMTDNNIMSLSELWAIFETRAFELLARQNRTAIVWQEAFENTYSVNLTMPRGTIVEVWKGPASVQVSLPVFLFF